MTEKGYDEGYDEGYSDGYDVGYDDGLGEVTMTEKSYDEGYEAGYDDGLDEGVITGKASAHGYWIDALSELFGLTPEEVDTPQIFNKVLREKYVLVWRTSLEGYVAKKGQASCL
jgi:flagellar biosynthesis/type III secretory pathway protein FliH